MDKTLYEITNNSRDIVVKLMENGGELTPELEEELKNIEVVLSHKIDAYQEVIRRAEHEVDYWKQREDEAKSVRKSCENIVDKLKSYIKHGMITLQRQELVGQYARFFLKRSKPSLKIIDETVIPPMYFEEKLVRTLNKDKLRYDIENGIIINGAVLEESYSLNQAPVKQFLK